MDDGAVFRCLNGECTEARGRCNRKQNCADGSDENGCEVKFNSVDLDPEVNANRPDDIELPGYYYVAVLLPLAGTYDLDVGWGPQPLATSPYALGVNYGPPCAATSTFSGAGVRGTTVSEDEMVIIDLVARDCFGNVRTAETTDPFALMAVLTPTPANEQYNYPMAVLVDHFEGAVVPDAEHPGHYSIEYSTTKAGLYEVRVTLESPGAIQGDHVAGSPFDVFVDPGPLEPGACTAQGTNKFGHGRDVVRAGDAGLFKIIARDIFTNARLLGGETFEATFSAAKVDSWYANYLVGDLEMQALGVVVGPAFLQAHVVDNYDSSYDASYHLTLAGQFRLEVFEMGTGRAIDGSPFTTTVQPAATYFPYCKASGPGLVGSVAGRPVQLLASAKDRYYNDRTEAGSDNFTLTLQGFEPHNAALRSEFSFTGFAPGVYNTSYSTTVAGVYSLYVMDYYTQVNIAGSPSLATVLPAATVAKDSLLTGLVGLTVKAGDLATFTLTPRDRYENPQVFSDTLTHGFKLVFERYSKIPAFWADSVQVPYEYYFTTAPEIKGAIAVTLTIYPMADYNIHVQYYGLEVSPVELDSTGVSACPRAECSPSLVTAQPLDAPTKRTFGARRLVSHSD